MYTVDLLYCTVLYCTVLYTVDLLYGRQDGVGLLGLTRDSFLSAGDEALTLRIFRWLHVSRPHTPNGALATYR